VTTVDPGPSGRERGAIDIYDPDWYARDDPHETFAELRRTDPVHWQDMPDGTGYWAILRHADLVHVARHPELFSSWRGGVVLEDPRRGTPRADPQHARGDGPTPAHRVP
jgi:cytochrome P450